MNKVNIGIIGAGKMGVTHCGAFMKHKKAKVVSVCDNDKAKADDLAEGNWPEVEYYKGRFLPKYVIKKVYDDYNELVSKSDIDAVVIATSEDTQYDIAEDALEHDKHVLLEKPFPDNYNQAHELVELADKKNLILSVSQCWRFHPHIQYAKNILESEILGEIMKVKGYGINDFSDSTVNSLINKENLNDEALRIKGIDLMDMISYLFEKVGIKYVFGNFMNAFGSKSNKDVGVVLMGFDSGASGIFEFGGPKSETDEGEAVIQLFGTNGYLRVFPTSIKLYIQDEKGEFYPELCDWYFTRELYIRQARGFINSILRGKENINSGRRNLETIKIINAIEQSKEENRIVFLDGL